LQLQDREELNAGEKQHMEPSSWGSKHEKSEYEGTGAREEETLVYIL